MIKEKMYKIIQLLERQSEMIKIMVFYRYASLSITSTFYLLYNSDEHSFIRRVFIITCISISSILVSYLYVKNEDSKAKIKLLILIETLGNSLILIPSGGLNSPYVWYTLNTILIASVILQGRYCWINLVVYLINATFISQLILGDKINPIGTIASESNLILSFILITAIIQLLSKYMKRIQYKNYELSQLNDQLVLANKSIQENMNYVMEIYQTVDIFSAQQNPDEFVKLIIDYGNRLLKTNIFVYLHPLVNKSKWMDKLRDRCSAFDVSIIDEISKNWDKILNSEGPKILTVHNKTLLLVCIKCNYKIYGVLGVDITDEKQMAYDDKENIEELKFLANLSAITLEKFELEQVNEELLINQEQNRIADEIHDGILQKLFSISCGIFEAIKNLDKTNVDEVEKELNTIRGAINKVMKDLRSTIYGLSWSKDGLNNFIVNIENYIHEIEILNNVEIDFHVEGNHESLSISCKKALYRIICEGIGNAVRHGQAKYIKISLIVDSSIITLEIVDKGKGFELTALEKQKKVGIGIKNIYQLTHSLNGVVNFQSTIGAGTRIDITIPNGIHMLCEEEVI